MSSREIHVPYLKVKIDNGDDDDYIHHTLCSFLLFGRASTLGQTQTGLGSRVYPFTTAGCCIAWIRCWQ